MKKFNWIIAIVFLLCGCGRWEYAKKKSDPALEIYLNEYLHIAPSNGHVEKLDTLVFGDTASKDDAAGLCRRTAYGIPDSAFVEYRYHIWIDRKYIGSEYLKTIVFHELAHCLHDFVHSDDTTNLMFHGVLSHNPNFRDVYADKKLQQLFYGAQQNEKEKIK